MDSLASSDDRSLSPSYPRIVKAFIGLQLAGGILLTVIWLTALLHPKITRYKTWHSFCFSWILSTVSYTLLTFAGQQFGPSPNPHLCLLQGGLIYAAPPLTSATNLALTTHTYLSTHGMLVNISSSFEMTFMIVLLLVPYILWLLMLFITLMWGANYPSLVMRSKNGTYCSYAGSKFSSISSILVLLFTIIAVSINVVVGYRLYKQRKFLSQSPRLVAMALRVMVFTICALVAIGLSVAWVLDSQHGQGFELVLALMPIAATLIFGSQRDLLQAWFSWIPRSSMNERDGSRVSMEPLLMKPIA